MATYYTYGSHDVETPRENDDSPKLTQKQMDKYKLGDILAFDDYRDVCTYIVGKDGLLVRNPDYSGSGYLSIPIEITKHLGNTYEHYQEHLISSDTCSVALELRQDDGWILAKFGQAFPAELKQIILWYSWGKFDHLWIDFGNGRDQEFGNHDEDFEEILNYYEDTKEVQSSFMAWYNIEGEIYDLVQEWKEKYKLQLPRSWRKNFGGGGGGYRQFHTTMYFYGPKKHYKEALDAVNKYYFFYKIKIKEASKDDVMIRANGSSNIGNDNFEPTGFYEETF